MKEKRATAQEVSIQEQLIKSQLLEIINKSTDIRKIEVVIHRGGIGKGRGSTCTHITLSS